MHAKCATLIATLAAASLSFAAAALADAARRSTTFAALAAASLALADAAVAATRVGGMQERLLLKVRD